MPPPAPPQKPFLITLQRLDETPSGSFRPGARVALTPSLRESGLLFAMPGDDLRNLLLVLTFAHPNGYVQPSLAELARALRQSPARTRGQMRRLERLRWLGRPIVYELRRQSGLHAYAPSPRILGVVPAPVPGPTPEPFDRPAYRTAPRGAVVALARAAYARPRAEVEREIARLNGWTWPPMALPGRHPAPSGPFVPDLPYPVSDPNNPLAMLPYPLSAAETAEALRADLVAVGVPPGLADRLLYRYDPDRIRRQIDFLPFRQAVSPPRLLVASIVDDYAPPVAVRTPSAPETADPMATTGAQDTA